MRFRDRVLLISGLSVWLLSFAYGATITGTVKGPDGAAFRGAFVEAQNKKTKITVNVLSDKQGRYRIPDLAAGEYRLQVQAIGYKGDPRSGVSLTGGQRASYDFALQKGTVRWSDISMYQGKILFLTGKGRKWPPDAAGPATAFRPEWHRWCGMRTAGGTG